NTKVPVEIIGRNRPARTVQIGRGGDGKEAMLSANTHRYHIPRYRLTQPHTSIKPAFYDVDKLAVADKVKLHLGICPHIGGHDMAKQETDCSAARAYAQRSARATTIVRQSVKRNVEI